MSDELPHLTFERKPVDYKDEDGHTLYRDDYFVTVRQRGGKDGNYYQADKWLAQLATQARDRSGFDPDHMMYAEWHQKASMLFEAFKKGDELPVDGMALSGFPGFSPSELMTCKAVDIYTLEQLSEATEVALSHMGPGGRALKMKAAKMLENYQSGKVAEENAALQLKYQELKDKYDELDVLVKQLLTEERETKRGRPRKEEAA